MSVLIQNKFPNSIKIKRAYCFHTGQIFTFHKEMLLKHFCLSCFICLNKLILKELMQLLIIANIQKWFLWIGHVNKEMRNYVLLVFLHVNCMCAHASWKETHVCICVLWAYTHTHTFVCEPSKNVSSFLQAALADSHVNCSTAYLNLSHLQ